MLVSLQVSTGQRCPLDHSTTNGRGAASADDCDDSLKCLTCGTDCSGPDIGLNTEGVDGLFCSVQCVRFYSALKRNNSTHLAANSFGSSNSNVSRGGSPDTTPAQTENNWGGGGQ